jgi:hypothetical protein
MKKKCFSCQEGAPFTITNLLQLHKNIFEQTGQVFWYFKNELNGQTKIADNESFKKILPNLQQNDGAEWCHIAEFGATKNDNVSKNTSNKGYNTAKSKSKPARVRKPLEKNI